MGKGRESPRTSAQVRRDALMHQVSVIAGRSKDRLRVHRLAGCLLTLLAYLAYLNWVGHYW
jgi:hypothetical protein